MLSIQTDEFLEAIQKGNLSKVNQLLETNPDLANSKAKDGTSVILLALYHGQRNIARAISIKKTELDIFEASTLGNGADPNTKTGDGKSPMSFAKEKNHVDVVEALKKHGAL